MNQLAKNTSPTEAISRPTVQGLESVMISGDLSRLSADQRVSYYLAVCDSVGLNPLTKPFEYIRLNGKEVLYALRAATDQLRQIHRVSVSIVARERHDDIYVVTARAVLPDGRCDESIGAVPIGGVKGENLANALMKAETKAKRRVTLAICGLSMLDETEVASIPEVAKGEPSPPPVRAVRSLDDVAAVPTVVGELEPPSAPATSPAPIPTRDSVRVPPEPKNKCPEFMSGPDKGKSYRDVPVGKLRALLASPDFRERASSVQIAWCEYLVAIHEAEKLTKEGNDNGKP